MKINKIVGVVSLLTLSAVAVSYASIDKNLKYGQRDKEVTELQEFLIDKGLLKTTPSNFFGLLTLKAVKVYQTSAGISPTGFVGALTREKINKEIDTEIASSNEAERVESIVNVNTPQTGTQPITNNQNTSSTPEDSVYDTSTKTDSLGRKVTIIQDPNYKFLNIVRAKVEVSGGKIITGFFYKNTKTFVEENATQTTSSVNVPNQDIVKLVDYCKNIEGTQTKVPDNMLVGNDGVCFTKQVQEVNSVTTTSVQNVPIAQQTEPIKILTIRSTDGINFQIRSNKDIDFSTLKFTMPVCSTPSPSGCQDWTNPEVLNVTVSTKEGGPMSNFCQNGICSMKNYNITLSKNLVDFVPLALANSGRLMKISISDTDGQTKVLESSIFRKIDGTTGGVDVGN